MNAVEEALYARLGGDASLRTLCGSPTGRFVFQGIAPAGKPEAGTVAVTFVQVSGERDYQLGSTAGPRRFGYLVKAVDQSPSDERAGQVDERIDALLNQHNLVVTGFLTMLCRRSDDRRYPENDNGRIWHHAGGVYDIAVTP